MNKPNLISLKKQMYYLLSNAPENYLLESEKALLNTLKSDMELQAELYYDNYMKGY